MLRITKKKKKKPMKDLPWDQHIIGAGLAVATPMVIIIAKEILQAT